MTKTGHGENPRKSDVPVTHRTKGNKTGTDKPKKRHRLTGAELDAHPAMIELRRMLRDGELDAGRTRDYLNKEGNKA